MPEANAQDGYPSGEALDDRHRHPGLTRRAGARRDDDAIGREGLHLVERDRVVATDIDVGAELGKILHEVVGEGIVVVDHQHSRHHSRSAMRTACTTARALLTHSRCSASGSESATIHAPAWMKARPSRISTERIAIAVSIEPP